MSALLLRVEGLTFSIGGTPILQGLSFDVRAGEILALAGQSGSGKSTTALAIARLLPRGAGRSGSITLDGIELCTQTERALRDIRGRDIGLVFQEPMTALNPVMTVGQQIAEPLRIHKNLGQAGIRDAVLRLLGRVGLGEAGVTPDRYPHELSGGQRQRVAIAIAVSCAPKLLIADEPTTALDVTTQAQLLKLFRTLAEEDKIGIVLITHDLAVVAETADRVAVMHGGKIIEEGSARDVLRSPRHSVTQDMVAALSRLPVRTSRPTAEPILEVSNLERRYGGAAAKQFTALHDVSFSLSQGESIGVVGESGSGKSTLLRAVLGLDKPNSGDVRIAGASLFGARGKQNLALRRKIQAVFQDPVGSFDPRFSVERIVTEPLHLLGERLSRSERRKKAETVLERVGLSGSIADRFPHEFSGGQRQRIAIARALIIEPSLLALDEAVSALDIPARVQILELLNALSRDLGISYFFVTHDLSLVRSITDRLIVLQSGRIIETGVTADVLASPQHPYTASLVAATPDFTRALA